MDQKANTNPTSSSKDDLSKSFIRKIKTEDPEPETFVKVGLILACNIIVEASIPFDEYFQLVYDNESGLIKDCNEDAEQVTMENKMKEAAPYNIFYTPLRECPETQEQTYSVRFTDLLCPSLGKLKCALHINFMISIQWLLQQYAARKLHHTPLTIIYGYEGFCWPKKETMAKMYPNIDYHHIEIKTEIGCHHAKLGVHVYEDDSLRLVIGSFNLYSTDWESWSQELWISPLCPKLPKGSSVMDGESPTGFKFALLDYLFCYNDKNIPSLRKWMDYIKNADFSDIKVALVFSTPGNHQPRKNGCLLHFLGHLLSRDCTIPAPKEEYDSWRIVAQTSALGLVGKHPEEWLSTYFLKSLSSHKKEPYLPTLRKVCKTKFSLIFPTIQNYLDGYLGAMNPYEKGVREQQKWLHHYMCQWKADRTKRTRAMSHSKCYFRISPCWQKVAFYFLSSSNLSRSAWGKIPDQNSTVFVRSYELGVLFFPKYFEEEYFEVKATANRKNKKLFPIMFDLPLTPYRADDESLCFEVLVDRELISLDALKMPENEPDNVDSQNKERGEQ